MPTNKLVIVLENYANEIVLTANKYILDKISARTLKRQCAKHRDIAEQAIEAYIAERERLARVDELNKLAGFRDEYWQANGKKDITKRLDQLSETKQPDFEDLRTV